MRRRRLRRCLAVSTVIGNMLMICITLSLAAVLVAWAGTSFGAFSGGSQAFFVQRGQALQERFVIEEVFFNKTAQQIFLFVRNVGPININIVAIYVNGTSLTPSTLTGHGWCSFSGTPPTQSLGVQSSSSSSSICEFSLTWPTCTYPPNNCPWITGNIFLIVVASTRGNQMAYTARAP